MTKTICFVSKEEYKKTFNAIRDVSENAIPTSVDSVVWPEELLTEEIYRFDNFSLKKDGRLFGTQTEFLVKFWLG